jgi:enoyl-CoA hydratase/carnithine racemase
MKVKSSKDVTEALVLREQPQPGVTLLRINRPDFRNALNLALRRELADHFTELADDVATRCVVLTGNAKAFAAGADILEMADASAIEMLQRGINRLLEPIAKFPKPLIAAVNGFALGGGSELAMHADIIIAGEGAKFGFPEVTLGVLPGGGGTQRLTRSVGKFRSMRWLLSGDFFSAAEALSMNMISEVVLDDEVELHALALASRIAKLAPLALAQIKEVVLAGENISLESALALERKALQLLFASADQKEGMRAFLEKRPAQFQGC